MAKTEKQTSKERKEIRILRTVVVVLLLFLLFLWAAYQYGWWPYNNNDKTAELGTAFSAQEQARAVSLTVAGATGNDGAAGSNGSSGSNGSNGGTTTPPATTPSGILAFAATVDTGDTKAEVSSQANGLSENCVIMADATELGKQEVCVYTDGDNLVTVTYLDDQVVSASRRGF